MDRSLAISLGIAAIAHAIVIGVMRPHVRQPVAATVNAATEVEIETETEIEQPVVEQEAPTASAGAIAKQPAIVISKPHPIKETVAIEAPAIVDTAPGPTSAPSGEPAPKVAAKFPSLINLDSPGSHAVIFPSSSPSAEVPKEKAAAAKLDAQLKSALDAKDTEVGSGFGGPIVSAGHVAANASAVLGWATFDVSTDALGKVTSVRVVDGNGDWKSVAKDIHASLGATRLKVPSGAAGVSVRIRVEATMKYPSGATTPITPTVGAGGVGGAFDLADIGQPKRRMVNVRIVAESRI